MWGKLTSWVLFACLDNLRFFTTYSQIFTYYWLQLNKYELTSWYSIQFSSVAQSCLTLCDPMNRSMPGLPVHHQLPDSTQTHVHWVGDAFQPSHPLPSPSPPALNRAQHQGLFQWVGSLGRLKRKPWDREHCVLDVNSDNLKGDPNGPSLPGRQQTRCPWNPPTATPNLEVCPRGTSHKGGSHLHSILKAASSFHEKPHVGLRLSPSSAQRVEQTQGSRPESGYTLLSVTSWILQEVARDTASLFHCVVSNHTSPPLIWDTNQGLSGKNGSERVTGQ